MVTYWPEKRNTLHPLCTEPKGLESILTSSDISKFALGVRKDNPKAGRVKRMSDSNMRSA